MWKFLKDNLKLGLVLKGVIVSIIIDYMSRGISSNLIMVFLKKLYFILCWIFLLFLLKGLKLLI